MNKELLEVLEILGKEKKISKTVLLDAIENSLLSACNSHFGTSENIKISISEKTGDYIIMQEKEVVEKMEDNTPKYKAMHISLADAKMIDPNFSVGDKVQIKIDSKNFGRIATGNAKNIILQKIREEERREMYIEYYSRENDIITGIIQRKIGRNISVNLGRCDAILSEAEQVKTEDLKPTERVKVYILSVENGNKGPKISVSRSHPDLVKRLFETEVSEIKDGTVEIKALAREAGSRTKMAVFSHDENVDPVGSCVGVNGARVNAVVEKLRGEKIDIIEWDENAAFFIESSLSPAKVIAVVADEENREAQVIVPDYQLSLAIGKEGQNARLAAKLTNYKIDIKSETQAREQGLFEELGIDYQSDETTDLEKSDISNNDLDDFDEDFIDTNFDDDTDLDNENDLENEE